MVSGIQLPPLNIVTMATSFDAESQIETTLSPEFPRLWLHNSAGCFAVTWTALTGSLVGAGRTRESYQGGLVDYLLRLSASKRPRSLIHTSHLVLQPVTSITHFPSPLCVLQRFVPPDSASRPVCCSLLQRSSIGKAFFLTEFAALSVSMQRLTSPFFRTFFPYKACKPGRKTCSPSLLARAFSPHPSQLFSFSCSASSPSSRAPACPGCCRCGPPKPALPLSASAWRPATRAPGVI
jgi:hypothetical protein